MNCKPTNIFILFVQVAFGTDFSKDPFVRGLCGDKDLLYFLDCIFEGIFLQVQNPLIPVSLTFKLSMSYLSETMVVLR